MRNCKCRDQSWDFKNQYQIIQIKIAVNQKMYLFIQSSSMHTFYLSFLKDGDTFQAIT